MMRMVVLKNYALQLKDCFFNSATEIVMMIKHIWVFLNREHWITSEQLHYSSTTTQSTGQETLTLARLHQERQVQLQEKNRKSSLPQQPKQVWEGIQ